jgi:1-acyl-sn-glycerol-3-phosphate acyltransferase
MPPALGSLWYKAWHAILGTYFVTANSLRADGRQNVPKTGPALLICNHESFIDPLLVAVSAPRELAFLARANVFRGPLGAFLRSLNTFPVDQEGFARDGLKTMIDLLSAGWPVLVFPEGERSWTGDMKPFRPGVHLIIKKTHAPIVPCGVAGAFETLPRSRRIPLPGLSPLFLPPGRATVAVSFGKPLDGGRFAKMTREEAKAELFEEVKKVQERAEHLRRR